MLFSTSCRINGFECKYNVTIIGNELRTTSRLDREEIVRDDRGEVDDTFRCSYELTNSVEQIEVTVLDVNDNVPRFRELDQVHVLNITENFNTPNSLEKLQVVDNDNGDNGTVDFSIIAGNEEHFFYIGLPLEYNGTDPNREELFFNRTVDYEQHQLFNLTIRACDRGTPRLCFDQVIIVEIIDLNDEGPYFPLTLYEINIEENHTLGPQNPFATISALDKDSIPSVLVYSIDTGSGPENALEYVGVNNQTGELYMKKAIDYETQPFLRVINVQLIAREPERPELAQTRITITVVDINDIKPEIEFKSHLIQLRENKHLAGAPLVFRAYDVESGGISQAMVQFTPAIDYYMHSTGRIFRIFINTTLDRETVDKITINFTVYDKGIPSLSNTEIITLDILDENDNSPNFTLVEYNTMVGDSAPLHKVVSTVTAMDPDFAENGTVSYTITSISPPAAQSWFNIDATTGDISVSGVLDYSLVQNASIIVTASDNGTIPLNSSATVNINISPSVTFKPRSYQEHCSPYTKIQDASQIYLEFHTSERNGLLFYEESVEGKLFALAIEDGRLIAIDETVVQSTLDVSINDWISALYNFDEVSAIIHNSVWEHIPPSVLGLLALKVIPVHTLLWIYVI